MSELSTFILASPEAANLVGQRGPAMGLAHIAVFLDKNDRSIEAHRAYAMSRLQHHCGASPNYTPADWLECCVAAAHFNDDDHALFAAYYRWLGGLIGMTSATFAHQGINNGGPTVDDIAPLHLSGPLADLARDRRVFGLGKYGVPLAAGHPDCRNGLRQEIGDCANYALGAGLERTHPDVFAQLTAALTATLAALDEQS